MRRRPIPPEMPVFIGASLIAYGAGAASRRSSRSSTYCTIFLVSYKTDKSKASLNTPLSHGQWQQLLPSFVSDQEGVGFPQDC